MWITPPTMPACSNGLGRALALTLADIDGAAWLERLAPVGCWPLLQRLLER